MQARPYQFPVASADRLQWAVMHDERLTLLLSDPDLPDSFRAHLRVVYIEQGWPEADVGDDRDFAYAVDQGNLVATMTYSCSKCGTGGSALLGWGYKPATANAPHRWGCKAQ